MRIEDLSFFIVLGLFGLALDCIDSCGGTVRAQPVHLPGLGVRAGADHSLGWGSPPFDDPSIRTSSGLSIQFYAHSAAFEGHVEGYEVSKKSIFENSWEVVSASASLSSSSEGQLDSQIISVRVDRSSPAQLSGGSFTLGIARSGLVPDDFEHLARTPRIPWNATAAVMKSALGHLKGVRVKEVRRCDEYGQGMGEVGHGGSEHWLGGCPFESEGGYKWLVVFEETIAGAITPELLVHRNELEMKWTGSGAQILVSRVAWGLVAPSACPLGVCRVNVTGLLESTPYLFRVRAKLSTFGWTDYSMTSAAITTQARRAPPKPAAPILKGSGPSLLELSLLAPPEEFGVRYITVEYREQRNNGDAIWVQAPMLDVLHRTNTDWTPYFEEEKNTFTIVLRNLNPATSYQCRIRHVNDVGVSEFSSWQTNAFATKPANPYLPEDTTFALSIVPGRGSEPPSLAIIAKASVESAGKRTYGDKDATTKLAIQYKSAEAAAVGSKYVVGGLQGWQTLFETIKLRTRGHSGVFVFEISTFSEVGRICRGNFQIAVIDDKGPMGTSQSTAIPFGASEDEMRAAILSIPRVQREATSVNTRRLFNMNGGYTWNIKIFGAGALPLPFVIRHDFKYSYQPPFDPSRNGSFPPIAEVHCWTSSVTSPVNIRLVSSGKSSQSVDEASVMLPKLLPGTKYEFRAIILDERSSPKNTEDVAVVSTISYQTEFSDDIYKRYIQSATGEVDAQVITGIPVDSGAIVASDAGSWDAHGPLAARHEDEDYEQGVGMGGNNGKNGGDGLCVISQFFGDNEQPFEVERFVYRGAIPYDFTVPHVEPLVDITKVVIKCWGGGGGGGQPSDQRTVETTSRGGGSAFAQVEVNVVPGDKFQIYVAGGGEGATTELGGVGGFGGGGNGGRGRVGGGGGGGGGVSMVYLNNELILAAGGGGGGGCSDYCCADGGGAGLVSGFNGTEPGAATPWPISGDGSTIQATPVSRRYEYTSFLCDSEYTLEWNTGGGSKLWCISQWDTLPASLPAEHRHIDYGNAPEKNFTVWASAGRGGGGLWQGEAGITSGFQVLVSGDQSVAMGDGRVAVYAQSLPAIGGGHHPTSGRYLSGGYGAEGFKGAGGGGGGYWGGGGGGSGIDASGGGGGSSFIGHKLLNGRYLRDSRIDMNDRQRLVPVPSPRITFINDTGVSITWSRFWPDATAGTPPSRYVVEMSWGPNSDEYYVYGNANFVLDASGFDASTIWGLAPSTTYRVRVVPFYDRSSFARGQPSKPLSFTTLHWAANYWERINCRRFALAATARGISGPVMQQPNIDTGSEVFTERATLNWEPENRYIDSTTQERPSMPSPRRGHTLTFIPSKSAVYMIGGRTDGYTCALSYIDNLQLGHYHAGRNIYPCVKGTAEVNEVWTWDVHTYQWRFINTSYGSWGGSSVKSPIITAREQHVTELVGRDLYVFGGRRHDEETGLVHFLDDLWRLNVENPTWAKIDGNSMRMQLDDDQFNNTGFGVELPRGRRAVFQSNGSLAHYGHIDDTTRGIGASEMCVTDMVIKVTISHMCINQLRISLRGPGASTGAANYMEHSHGHEIILMDQQSKETAFCTQGVKELEFVDRNSVLGMHYAPTSDCCSANKSSYFFISDGSFAEFAGAPIARPWTLVVQDMITDDRVGSVLAWSLNASVKTCYERHSWTNITAVATGSKPSARYGAKSFVHLDSLFIYGGRDSRDFLLFDLYRLNTTSLVWASLRPSGFREAALDTASMVGASFSLTFWGFIRFGGLYRLPSDSRTDSNYVNDVYVMDPVTMKWTYLSTEADHSSPGSPPHIPARRYLAGLVNIPSRFVWWSQSTTSYRSLYDQRLPSSSANYAGSEIDSLMMFGGFDGATGIMHDGSSGGLLSDMWQLRLGNLSTPERRDSQRAYMQRHCSWRTADATARLPPGCFNVTGTATASSPACALRDLLLTIWCSLGETSVMKF